MHNAPDYARGTSIGYGQTSIVSAAPGAYRIRTTSSDWEMVRGEEASAVANADVGRRSVEPRAEPASLRRDIVVIGVSTGGMEALRRVLQTLPADLSRP